MSWISKFFTSSIGQKIIMSLTGLFLILFLVVHLVGNIQLLYNDGGESFNLYSAFMTSNPIIKTISYGLYFFIVLHTIQGISISLNNRKAKGSKYHVSNKKSATWQSKNMMILGLLIFAFLCIHMGDFWWKMKMDHYELVNYAGHDGMVQDMFTRVNAAFDVWWIVLIYIIGMIALFFHLNHGFQSAFQTLGLNHSKYTPFILFVGKLYSVVVSVGFAIIPIWMYFN